MADTTQQQPHPRPLTDPKEVDLKKHAVIEASAGTGKTYTIERLFIRLLTEEPALPIEKILVVTFTEKATGEMKDRIRKAIEKQLSELDDEHADRPLLTVALQGFDNAQISTIHGFCHRMLREYAYENGQQFDYDVAADKDLYEKLIHHQMREIWPQWYGDTDPLELLASADFPNHNRGTGSGWIKKVTEIAAKWNPDAAELLDPPDPGEGSLDVCLARYQTTILQRLSDICGPVDSSDPESNAFYQAYGKLNPSIVKTRQTEVLIHVIKLLHHAVEWQAQETAETAPDIVIDRITECFDACSETGPFKRNGFNCLMPTDKQWEKTGNNMAEACPKLEHVISILQQLRSTRQNGRGLFFTVKAIAQLQRDVELFKDQQGILTYNDMIDMLATAVADDTPEEGAPRMLVQALRKRFAVALVDEFQDTDLRQWTIFKRAFVDAPDDTPADVEDGGERPGSAKPGRRLVVVGDPKQAIYRFRGADLNAYFLARTQLLALGDSHTVMYSLETNWRSAPELIDAFNALFRDDRWFTPGDPIDSRLASCPAEEMRRSRLYEDNTETPALIGVELNDVTTTKRAQKEWFIHIAQKIKRLLDIGPEPALLFGEPGGPPRRLQAEDICVLTRTGAEAVNIEKILAEYGVPRTIYKKSGVYESVEALELVYLLKAIAEPANDAALRKALLTSFFGIPLSDITRFEGLPPTHAIKVLFARWATYADKRQWPTMFHSIRTDTGVLFRNAESPDHERKLTNQEQILQQLQGEITRQSLDIIGACNLLKNLRSGLGAVADDEDLHRRETERQKVQIMTIHKSKGLEFPVVFIAGGVTQGPSSGAYYRIHRDGKTVFDLTCASKQQHQADEMAETRRLFYVALTRAKFKLYVPRIGHSARGSGPAATVVTAALAAAATELKELRPTIDVLPAQETNTPSPETSELIIAAEPILPPDDLPLRNWSRSLAIESYSNLKQRTSVSTYESTMDESQIEYDEQWHGSRAEDEPGKDAETEAGPGLPGDEAWPPVPGIQQAGLPGGTRTGNVLHGILESVNFGEVGRAANAGELLTGPAGEVIDRWMRRYRMPAESNSSGTTPIDYRAEVARLVWTALQLRLPNGVRLCELDTNACKHELEFYFPYPNLHEAGIPEIHRRHGYVKGFIDLVYRWEGTYHILDWKSDTLPDYTPVHLQEHMVSNRYDFQHQLYTIAVQRWLEEFGLNGHLGGVIYLFLRGLEPGSENGIYEQKFVDDMPPMKAYTSRLNAVLQGTQENDETMEGTR